MLLKRIFIYCKKNELTISAFEKKCGIGNGTVKRWRYKSPSLRSLIKISKATKIPLNLWIDGVDYYE